VRTYVNILTLDEKNALNNHTMSGMFVSHLGMDDITYSCSDVMEATAAMVNKAMWTMTDTHDVALMKTYLM
jgi:hypothetical protein